MLRTTSWIIELGRNVFGINLSKDSTPDEFDIIENLLRFKEDMNKMLKTWAATAKEITS
jgi:hypothetical protein